MISRLPQSAGSPSQKSPVWCQSLNTGSGYRNRVCKRVMSHRYESLTWQRLVNSEAHFGFLSTDSENLNHKRWSWRVIPHTHGKERFTPAFDAIHICIYVFVYVYVYVYVYEYTHILWDWSEGRQKLHKKNSWMMHSSWKMRPVSHNDSGDINFWLSLVLFRLEENCKQIIVTSVFSMSLKLTYFPPKNISTAMTC